jgi:hypothetical protein
MLSVKVYWSYGYFKKGQRITAKEKEITADFKPMKKINEAQFEREPESQITI